MALRVLHVGTKYPLSRDDSREVPLYARICGEPVVHLQQIYDLLKLPNEVSVGFQEAEDRWTGEEDVEGLIYDIFVVTPTLRNLFEEALTLPGMKPEELAVLRDVTLRQNYQVWKAQAKDTYEERLEVTKWEAEEATHPRLVCKTDSREIPQLIKMVSGYATLLVSDLFAEQLWPLVKDRFEASLVKLELGKNHSHYCLVIETSLLGLDTKTNPNIVFCYLFNKVETRPVLMFHSAGIDGKAHIHDYTGLLENVFQRLNQEQEESEKRIKEGVCELSQVIERLRGRNSFRIL